MNQSGPQLNRDPQSVKFVTSDIDNFWRAYDLAANETAACERSEVHKRHKQDHKKLRMIK